MGFFQEKNIKKVQEKVVGVTGEMRFEDSHVERMTASCAQRDGNISLRVRTVIRGPNFSEASYNVFTKPATFDG